jgi:hypothetical protein
MDFSANNFIKNFTRSTIRFKYNPTIENNKRYFDKIKTQMIFSYPLFTDVGTIKI